MKKLIIPKTKLTKIIQNAVQKKLNEQNFNIEPHINKTDREVELEKVFGKYSGEIPPDVVRYMRKNPKLIITRLLDIYGTKMIEYILNDLKSELEPAEDILEPAEDIIEEFTPNSNENDEDSNKYPVEDIEFDMDQSDIDDILNHEGDLRRFRGSIYVDDIVPETNDKEYDREVAKKMMEYYRKQIKNMETYVGGVGFRQNSLLDPYDNMDF